MDPTVEAAVIGAAATLITVGGTVAVAFLGFRNSQASNQAALKAAHDANKEALDAIRAGQLADRYTRAIDQLGSTTVDVTIGGIYALERIARDSPEDYHPTVTEVLAACIRENSKKPLQEPVPSADKPGPGTPEPVIRPDIQAAMTVIARRDTEHDVRQINLRGVHLPRADLPSADLSGTNLARANLAGANLAGAKIVQEDLPEDLPPRYTNLSGADLSDAILPSADLRGADLSLADLRRTNLRRGPPWHEPHRRGPPPDRPQRSGPPWHEPQRDEPHRRGPP